MTDDALYSAKDLYHAVRDVYGPPRIYLLNDLRTECGTLGMPGAEVRERFGTIIADKLVDRAPMTSEEKLAKINARIAKLREQLFAQGLTAAQLDERLAR